MRVEVTGTPAEIADLLACVQDRRITLADIARSSESELNRRIEAGWTLRGSERSSEQTPRTTATEENDTPPYRRDSSDYP